MATAESDLAATADSNVRRFVQVLMSWHDVEPSDLATLLSISRSSVYERLSGRSKFTVREVATMAEAFNVSVEVFFRGPDGLGEPGDLGFRSRRWLSASSEARQTLSAELAA